jgi:hypothetical protein
MTTSRSRVTRSRSGWRVPVRRFAWPRGRPFVGDRGDVPGWVLVAVMTAGLVTAIWLVADDQLTMVLGRAIGSVTQP